MTSRRPEGAPEQHQKYGLPLSVLKDGYRRLGPELFSFLNRLLMTCLKIWGRLEELGRSSQGQGRTEKEDQEDEELTPT